MINIQYKPWISQAKPWWIPFISLFVCLYGILVQDWNLNPIIFLFWWELMLMLGAAILRMLFAMDGRPVLALLAQKAGLLLFSLVMGGAMIMLAVSFSIKAFEPENSETLAAVPLQSRIMAIGYALGLALHFFLNKRYKRANPASELMHTFAQLLILLALLMAISMHFLPAYPGLNQAKGVAVAVVGIKFLVDFLFNRIRGPLK